MATSEIWYEHVHAGDKTEFDLTTTSNIPANTSITVTIYEDVNNDGSGANSVTDVSGTTHNYENSASVSLSGGTDETNTLTGFDGGGTENAYLTRVEIAGNGTDPTLGAGQISSLSYSPNTGLSWEWDEFASQAGVVHQSTPNTDHNDAGILKQGYDYANFAQITPTPIGCWPLHDADTANLATDVAGTNDGTINGVTMGAEGILGSTAGSFDGTDDYVDISQSFSSTFDGDFTIAFWMTADSTSGDSRMPLSFFDESANAHTPRFRVRSGSSGTGDVLFQIQDEGGTFHTITATDGYATGDWRFYVGTKDSNGMEFFVNATSEGTDAHSGTANATDSTPLDFGGGRYSGFGGEFDGDIAEVSIYDTALSASQIQTRYDVVDTAGSWTSTTKTL